VGFHSLVQPFKQCQFLLKNIRAAETVERSKQYVGVVVVDIPDYCLSSFVAKLSQSLPAMMSVDYLKTGYSVVTWIPVWAGMTIFFRAGPNYQRLISTGLLNIANQLCKVGFAHSVRVVRMSNELFKFYPRYSILVSRITDSLFLIFYMSNLNFAEALNFDN
jgi:hypothetical protein